MRAFTALLVLAGTTFSYVAANPSETIHELFARQSVLDPSIIPEQCRDQCTPLLNSFNSGSCNDLDCICGSDVANKMINCLKCGVPIVGADAAQNGYKSYADTCKSAGKDVPNFTASSGGGGKNGASRIHLTGASLAGAVGVGLFLAA